jgi:hypothetical protein
MSQEMDDAVAKMDAAITKATTVEAGAAVFIRSVAAKIIELQNEPARLVAYANTLETASDDLQSALVEGTPAEPTP